jgi:hypothetical protein
MIIVGDDGEKQDRQPRIRLRENKRKGEKKSISSKRKNK